jgi:hypothetical protein
MAQYLLGQPEYQVAAENMIPEGQSAGAAPFVRLPPAPDRSGLSGNAERNLGENSLARIPDLLNTEIKIGPDGTITTVPPKKSEATQEGGVPAESVEQMLKRRLAAQEADKTTANDAAKPVADTASQGGGTSGGTGGGGGGGGGGRGGALSPYEQQLMDAIAAREKAAKQDKWLALAQIGLSMMSSTQPTLLGAVGEAGLKGIEALRAARDKYDEDKLSLQAALEKSRMARASAAASAARGASRRAIPEGALDMYDAEIETLTAAMSDPTLTKAQNLAASKRLDAILAEKAQFRDAYRAQFGIEPTGASPAATSGVVFEDVPQ